MKAKIYVGAKKYALYIGCKIVEKTLEFLTLPARFVSKRMQELKNLTMYGQSVQNGTPTPTAPVEIESVGDKSNNLFDKNDTSSYIKGYLEGNGTIPSAGNGYMILLECKPNTTYTFSRKESSNRYRVGSTPVLKNNIKVGTSGITLISSKRVDETVLTDTFTTTSDAKTLLVWFTNTSDLSVLQSQLNQIQIEEGTIATSYEPYGYKVPVEVGGKNLFDYNYYFNNKQTVTGSGVQRIELVLKPNTTYYAWCDFGDSITACYAFCWAGKLNSKSPNSITNGVANSVGRAITTGEDGILTIGMYTLSSSPYQNSTLEEFQTGIKHLQIEKGNAFISYQPYTEPTTTNIYLNEPLRKIGDYADTLSVDGTEVTVTRNVKSEKLGTTGWEYQSQYTRFVKNFMSFISFGVRVTPLLSSCFIKCDDGRPVTSVLNNSVYSGSENYNIYFKTDVYNTVESFTEALKDVDIVYPLTTPTTETYTIESPIQLQQGTLTLDTDTNIKPSKINITGDIDNE